MLESLVRPFRNLDRRVRIAIISNGLVIFGTQLSARYDTIYATYLGANPLDLGLLSSIGSFFAAIFAVPLGWAVERYSVKKVMLVGLTSFIAHVVLFALAGNWFMLVGAYILSTKLLRTGPLSDIIFVTATEPQRRVTVISLSRVVWNMLSVFAPMIAAFMVTYFGGMNDQGIRPLYYLQLVMVSSALLLVAWKLPPTLGQVDKRDKSGSSWSSLIKDYRNALKSEKYLKRWVVLRVVMTFGTNLVTPFTPLWLVETKGATPYILGTIGTTSLILALVLQIPVGRLADKIGRKRVYFMLYPLTYVGTFLAILIPNSSPEYLVFAGLMGGYVFSAGGGGMAGGISSVAQPLFVTWWWESVPEEKRGRFFGIEGLFNLAAIPASIIGGVLWQQGFVMHVLLIPILLDLIAVYPLLATIPDITRSKQ